MTASRTAATVADHIRVISRLLRHAIETEAQGFAIPLTPPQVHVMETLTRAHHDGNQLSLSELSSRMGLAHSTVSGIVTRLERHGLVRRRAWDGDRRQIRIELTDQVQNWLDHDLPRLRQQPLTAALKRLGTEQTAALVDGLAFLRKHLEEG